MTSGAHELTVPPVSRRLEDGKKVVAQTRKRVTGDPTLCGLALLNGLVGSVLVGGIGAWTLATFSVDDTSHSSVSETAAATVAFLFSGLCSAAVVAACAAQDEGREVTVRVAWSLLRKRWAAVVAWVVLSVAVRMVPDALLGAGSQLLFLAWWLFTVYALPVAVLTGALPHRALVQSVRLVSETFRHTLRDNLRALFPWLLWTMASLIVTGIGTLVHEAYAGEVDSWAVAGVVLAVIGLAGMMFALAMQSAVTAVLNTTVLRAHDAGGDHQRVSWRRLDPGRSGDAGGHGRPDGDQVRHVVPVPAGARAPGGTREKDRVVPPRPRGHR